MIEVDRIMMQDLGIPLESMMEHAGLNLARLVLALSDSSSRRFRVIVGTGSNGGGGLVAARRLRGWGFDTEVVLPRKTNLLRTIPAIQLERAVSLGVNVTDSLPEEPSEMETTVIDAYLGYGFKPRRDEISQNVFSYLRSESQVISLDIPSGMDSTSGDSFSDLKPIATMTIAFVKNGLLESSGELTGALFVTDIGVPMDVYLSKLNLSWEDPYTTDDLELLYTAFAEDPLQKVRASESSWSIDKR